MTKQSLKSYIQKDKEEFLQKEEKIKKVAEAVDRSLRVHRTDPHIITAVIYGLNYFLQKDEDGNYLLNGLIDNAKIFKSKQEAMWVKQSLMGYCIHDLLQITKYQ